MFLEEGLPRHRHQRGSPMWERDPPLEWDGWDGRGPEARGAAEPRQPPSPGVLSHAVFAGPRGQHLPLSWLLLPSPVPPTLKPGRLLRAANLFIFAEGSTSRTSLLRQNLELWLEMKILIGGLSWAL